MNKTGENAITSNTTGNLTINLGRAIHHGSFGLGFIQL